jgi:ADP-glucose pyrophosphorylase
VHSNALYCNQATLHALQENCTLERTLLMGSDYYEKPDECELVPGCLPMGIGEGSILRKCIVDKNARIGPHTQLINKDGVSEANRRVQCTWLQRPRRRVLYSRRV